MASKTGKIGDIKLSDLVLESSVSTRLRHAISRAEEDKTLPVHTIREYIELGPYASVLIKSKLPNFGNVTSRELEKLVLSVVNNVSRRQEAVANKKLNYLEKSASKSYKYNNTSTVCTLVQAVLTFLRSDVTVSNIIQMMG